MRLVPGTSESHPHRHCIFNSLQKNSNLAGNLGAMPQAYITGADYSVEPAIPKSRARVNLRNERRAGGNAVVSFSPLAHWAASSAVSTLENPIGTKQEPLPRSGRGRLLEQQKGTTAAPG